MSGIEERPISREEMNEWDTFVKGYLNVNLYLGPSKALIITEFLVAIFIFGIVALFAANILVPEIFVLALIILGVIPLYWGGDGLGKYLGWRERRNEWIRRATG